MVVSVFYESLCPDSIKLVKQQLFPNFEIFQNYVDWELVPFGKAKVSRYITSNQNTEKCSQAQFI